MRDDICLTAADVVVTLTHGEMEKTVNLFLGVFENKAKISVLFSWSIELSSEKDILLLTL